MVRARTKSSKFQHSSNTQAITVSCPDLKNKGVEASVDYKEGSLLEEHPESKENQETMFKGFLLSGAFKELFLTRCVRCCF